jgi:hypothetical protein
MPLICWLKSGGRRSELDLHAGLRIEAMVLRLKTMIYVQIPIIGIAVARAEMPNNASLMLQIDFKLGKSVSKSSLV